MSDFNAAHAYAKMREKYIHFLLDKMVGNIPEAGNENQWNAVRNQLKKTWLDSNPDKGIFPAPMLESLFGYRTCDADTADLIAEQNAAEPSDVKPIHYLLSEIIPNNFRMYTHQLQSLKAYNRMQNMIISSGTGSGKTECFLYPMINRILWERTANGGQLPAGVKVLLVYPMNALINDQRNRIVKMLAQGNTGLRVGVFTSQTRETLGEHYHFKPWQNDIKKELMEERHFSEDESCERIQAVWCESREAIRNNPPDILITNYSMLEYMLLREKDQRIFIPGADPRSPLQTIVLDEAHIYSGTLGDDLHMLLRRTLIRMGILQEENRVRFIATSATIGDNEELKKAAKALFFGKDETDRDDGNIEVIVGERVATPYLGDENQFSETLRSLRSRLIGSSDPIELSADELSDWQTLDETTRNFIPGKLHTFFKLPEIYYSDLNVSPQDPLGNLSVSPLRDDFNAIPCYYASGARRTIYFNAHFTSSFVPGEGVKAFLHAPFDQADKAVPVFFRLAFPNDMSSLRFNLSRENNGWLVNKADDGHFAWAMNIKENNFVLRKDYFTDDSWKTPEGKAIAVREHWDTDEEDLPENNDKRYLFPLGHVSKNMMTTVLTENMMEFLPDSEKNTPQNPLPWKGRQALLFADSRGSAAWNAVSIQNWRQRDYVRNTIYYILQAGPKSIEDITGDMIDYAPELSVPQRIRRRIQEKKMENKIVDTFIPALVVGELAVPLAGSGRTLEAMHLVSPVYDGLPACPADFLNIPNVRDKWQSHILPEIFNAMRRMGKIYHKPIQDVIENCVVDRRDHNHYWENMIPFRLAQAGAGRTYKAIRDGFDPIHNRHQYLCNKDEFRGRNGNQSIRKIIAHYWNVSVEETIDKLANQIFDTLCGCNISYLKIEQIGRHNHALCVDAAKLKFQRDSGRFIAHNESHEIKVIPAGAAIPENWHDVDNFWKQTDDWNIFTGDEIGNIVAAEHSAQLENEDLEFIETNFKANKINLISCTPTMEIGIDIGSLNAVMQGNLPPERANYVQRVGRAGRRGNNSALAVTILSDSMFDTYISRDPTQIYRRRLTFAKTDLKRDEQEIKRHIHMFFISEYFKNIAVNGHIQGGNNPLGAWESVGHFFADEEILRGYRDILDRERNLFVEETAERIDRNIASLNQLLNVVQNKTVTIPVFGNLKDNMQKNEGTYRDQYTRLIRHTACEGVLSFEEALDETRIILERIGAQCISEWQYLIESLNGLINNPEQDAQWSILKSLVMQLEKSFQEGLVEFLGRKRVIPAYGFPLDVVSLYTDDGNIERDLKSAIREFAPGNTLIKSMDAYTVKGLMPNLFNREDGAYDMLYFAHCPSPSCQQINVGAVQPVHCQVCGAEIHRDSIRSAVKPNGFSTYPGKDASAFLSRPSLWTKSDVTLNLEPVTFARSAAETALQFTSLKPDKDVIYRNLGAHGYGYWLCSCNAMGSELSYNDQTDRAYAAHMNNGHGGNHTIRKRNVSIACQGKANVWLCRIPAAVFNDNTLTDVQIATAGKIISTALQVEAAKTLNTDSRIFESYHFFKQGEGLTLCLYEAGASSGYLKSIKGDERNFVLDALKLITDCNCKRGCGNCILNYSSAFTLRQISEGDYAAVKQWIQDHMDPLFASEDPRIAGQPVCSADLFELKKAIRYAHTVHLVLPDFERSMLQEEKNLINQLSKLETVSLNVYIRNYIHNGCYIEKQESYLTEQKIVDKFKSSTRRVKFFVVDDDWFDNGMGKNLFMQIDNKDSFTVEDTIDRNQIVSSWENDFWNFVCKVTDDQFRPTFPVSGDSYITERLSMPQCRSTFKFDKDQPFDFSNDVLSELQELPGIKELTYSDCYLITPLHWAVLMQLLADLPLRRDCKITIKTLTLNPSKHRQVEIESEEAMQNLSPRSWSILKNVGYGYEAAVSPEQDCFIKEIYKGFLPIDTDVTITRVQRGFHAGGTQLEHYRFIKMTFENDEVMSIFLDSGVSAIGFQYFARNTDCYFGDNRECLKILKDTTVYVVDGE